jgi:hypothetical protein
MSVLDVIQDAMSLCGFPKPSIIVGSADAAVAAFEAQLRFEADELAQYVNWRNLKIEAQLIGDGASVEYVLPVDFQEFIKDEDGRMMFRSGQTGQFYWNVSDGEWTRIRAQNLQIGPYPVWRLFGNMVEFSYAPPDGETLIFEYMSSFWISSADNTARRNRWAADDDYFLLPESLLTRGIQWRFKESKGLEYAENFRTYQIQRDILAAKNNPRRNLTGPSPRNRGVDIRQAYPGPLGS